MTPVELAERLLAERVRPMRFTAADGGSVVVYAQIEKAVVVERDALLRLAVSDRDRLGVGGEIRLSFEAIEGEADPLAVVLDEVAELLKPESFAGVERVREHRRRLPASMLLAMVAGLGAAMPSPRAAAFGRPTPTPARPGAPLLTFHPVAGGDRLDSASAVPDHRAAKLARRALRARRAEAGRRS